jgi:hypothetical protein
MNVSLVSHAVITRPSDPYRIAIESYAVEDSSDLPMKILIIFIALKATNFFNHL